MNGCKRILSIILMSVILTGCSQRFSEIMLIENEPSEEQECRLPRYLTKPRQRRSEWDMAGSDGISRVSTVFRGKSLLTNKMRII